MTELKYYTLYVDGGGTTEVPCYFSFKCPESLVKYSYKVGKNTRWYEVRTVEIERFYLRNLAPKLLPFGCKTVDSRGLETNNIAEFCAIYFGIQRFKQIIGTMSLKGSMFRVDHHLTVFSDSQLVINSVFGSSEIKKDHLKWWHTAVTNLIDWPYCSGIWIPRDNIVKQLGH